MNNHTFLQDKRFLQQLDSLKIKQQFIKITVLNWDEEPIRQIQGIAINGSINLDGSSSMRRTATLSLLAEGKNNDLTNINNLFSINKKCILELGIVNNVPKYILSNRDKYDNIINTTIDYQQLYGNIVWFPLGVYVMFNPSIAHSLEGVTISMQLKDKMCLLNGDLGGEIHSSVIFSQQDEIYDENESVTIYKKPTLFYNIIKQLVNHWGKQSLNKIIISEVPLQIKKAVQWTGSDTIYLVQKVDSNYYTLETSIPSEGYKKIQPFSKNDFIGFVYSDFVYPGQPKQHLICNAGDTVCSVLDKIIGYMGNHEYFYDIYGNFVFQEKQNYLNMTNVAYWTKKKSSEQESFTLELPSDEYKIDIKLNKPVYNFNHNQYTTAYNNTLNFNNIKNDFVVWGYRKVGTETVGCRYHLAIDKKPSLGTHKVAFFKDSFEVVRGISYNENLNYQQGSTITWLDVEYKIFKIEERTSKDWREQIYYQMLESEKLATDNNTEINNSYFQYYAELKEQFPKIFDLEEQKYKIDIINYPSEINYFLDFIDDSSQLGQYSVKNIGRRSKIIEDNNEGINCVFEPSIPDIVYIDASLYKKEELNDLQTKLTVTGQEWTQIRSSITPFLKIGQNLNSCYEEIKNLLYQYTHENNTISITTLPIYYLEPNTRISVEDDLAGIHGDYIIQSISLPLDISSTMTINAYKALQKI